MTEREDTLRKKIIEKILKNIPSYVTPANYISELLNISVESAYRRLRGNVSFSAEELIILSNKLNFLVDSVSESNQEIAIFNLNGHSTKTTKELFFTLVNNYATYLRELYPMKSEKFSCILTGNRLLNVFVLSCDNLFKLFYFKWARQKGEVPINMNFSDMSIPDDLTTFRKETNINLDMTDNTTYILEQNIVDSTVTEILYFYKLGLLNDNELMTLKQELYELITQLEKLAAHGYNKYEKTREIYIADYIGSNTLYVNYDNIEESFFWVYAINPIRTKDEKVCLFHKIWIETLKKHSVLISRTNELARFEFINAQLKYLDSKIKI